MVAQRLEGGQIESTLGAFREVFSMMDSRSESMKSRSKPGVGWRLALREFGDDTSAFVE